MRDRDAALRGRATSQVIHIHTVAMLAQAMSVIDLHLLLLVASPGWLLIDGTRPVLPFRRGAREHTTTPLAKPRSMVSLPGCGSWRGVVEPGLRTIGLRSSLLRLRRRATSSVRSWVSTRTTCRLQLVGRFRKASSPQSCGKGHSARQGC